MKFLYYLALFNKLAVCFDVIGRTAETFSDVKFENLRAILTSDKRIGNWGFYLRSRILTVRFFAIIIRIYDLQVK